jgi:hypothetical protein
VQRGLGSCPVTPPAFLTANKTMAGTSPRNHEVTRRLAMVPDGSRLGASTGRNLYASPDATGGTAPHSGDVRPFESDHMKGIDMTRMTQLPGKTGALAGFAFAVLLFVSVAAVDPLRHATDQQLLDWWQDGGIRRDSLISMYSRLLSSLCFLVFLVHLRARMKEASPTSLWSDVATGAGLVFVATLSMGSISRGLIAQSVRFGDDPLPGPDMLRYVTQMSSEAYGLVAMPFATVVVAATSFMVLQSGAMARWIGWLGLVVTALSAACILMLLGALSTPLIIIWVMAVGTQFLREPRAEMIADGIVAELAPNR